MNDSGKPLESGDTLFKNLAFGTPSTVDAQQLNDRRLAATFGTLKLVEREAKKEEYTKKRPRIRKRSSHAHRTMNVAELDTKDNTEMRLAEMLRVVKDLQTANKKIHRRVQQNEAQYAKLLKRVDAQNKLHSRIQRLEALATSASADKH